MERVLGHPVVELSGERERDLGGDEGAPRQRQRRVEVRRRLGLSEAVQA